MYSSSLGLCRCLALLVGHVWVLVKRHSSGIQAKMSWPTLQDTAGQVERLSRTNHEAGMVKHTWSHLPPGEEAS